jgi:CDP-diglyceride synthetase
MCIDVMENSMDLGTVLQFHQSWFWVAVISTGIVGVWGLVLAVMKRKPGRTFNVARALAIVAMLVQVAAGVYLYSNGLRPGNSFHVFYGVVIVVTLTLAYLYRSTMAKRPALTYGVLLLFVMGLGLRAWANVA